jgi:hypothetical protein
MPIKYRKKSNRTNCGMTYTSSYRTPCQSLPLDANFAIGGQYGGNNGCVSYNVDVNAPQVAGQPVISGNPVGCLSSQMLGPSSFNQPNINYQAGGGASCTGVGFDLSNPIGGSAGIVNYAPNCLYGETAQYPNAVLSGGEMNTPSPVLSGGGKKKKKKNKYAKGVNMTKRNQKAVKSAINNYCRKKKIKCSKKIKNKIYNTVIRNLCN